VDSRGFALYNPPAFWPGSAWGATSSFCEGVAGTEAGQRSRPATGQKVTGTIQPNARRLAFSCVLGQAAVSAAAGLIAWSAAGSQAALSALLGGGISTAGSLAMALVAFRRGTGVSALQMLTALLVGEAAKFLVIVVLFVVVLMLMKVSPVPMFITYVATFFVYWAAFAGQRGQGGERASAPTGRERQ
jgi:ATP synthase protein I